MAKNGKVATLDPVSNGAETAILSGKPYRLDVEVQGVAPLLMHGWNIEAVEQKAKAAKGSKEKKSDDLESYVYRTPSGELALKGDALRAAMALAGKFKQDPRSPRKSAHDLVKSGLIPLDEFASLGVKEWDYIARHRVVVQRNSITRSRPALNIGWKCDFSMMVTLPEYLTVPFIQDLISDAGKFCALGDYRPTFGRFTTTSFKTSEF